MQEYDSGYGYTALLTGGLKQNPKTENKDLEIASHMT
jgi:hypothetical protein